MSQVPRVSFQVDYSQDRVFTAFLNRQFYSAFLQAYSSLNAVLVISTIHIFRLEA
jgi:hypothetical protein